MVPIDRNRNWWYVSGMARTNMDGKGIKRVLEWLLDQDLKDADLAAALGISESSYSRNKDGETFPSFEELETLGSAFGISPTVLQIAFGFTDSRMLPFLTEAEFRQYLELGGGNHLGPTLELRRREEYAIPGRKRANPIHETHSIRTAAAVRDELDEFSNAPWLARPPA